MTRQNLKFICHNKKGVSILEVIVAIVIITIGMVGVLSLVIQNVQAQYIDKNVLIASGLGQECLELVRNIRDLNWLTPNLNPVTGWKLGTGAGSAGDIVRSGNNYAIDYSRAIKIVNSVVDDARLYVNSNGFYTHTSSGNAQTNFFRFINVIDHTDYLDIKCTIRWTQGAQNHDYAAETYLYNWR